MNKNVMGIVFIILAAALLAFYAWPKMKPYVSAPPAGEPTEMTTAPLI